MKVLLVLLAVTTAYAQVTDILCPIPGEPDSVTLEECSAYTACEYTNGVCHMSALAGYTVSSEPNYISNGFLVNLTKTTSTSTLFGADISTLLLEVLYHEDYHVQVKLQDAASSRYEVPYALNLPDTMGLDPMYQVIISEPGEPFSMNITRRETGTHIFQVEGPLSYEDQFLQITTELPSEYMYGLGEQFHTSLKHSFEIRKTASIFNRDQILTEELTNEYGTHPYYVVVEDDEGYTHGVLLYSSNALEYTTFNIGGNPAVTMRSIGGIFDFHFLLGPTPEDVNVEYANLVGTTVFPKYWTFGFTLSRYGYNSSANYREVYARNKAAGIPIDVQTFDIDYMYRRRDFTYDLDTYSDFPELVQELHDDGLKVILMFDPALVVDWDNYEPSSRGRDSDVFIKWSDSSLVPDDQAEGAGEYIVGFVWPDNKTVFPDFLNPVTTDWWTNELQLFHDVIEYDGIWIDMNEPANFGTDTDRPFNYPEELPDWSLKCPDNALDSPPYPTRAATGPLGVSGRISDKTLCMSAAQTDGTNTYYHYDVHSLYGISQTFATTEAHAAIFPGERVTLLSRSTFPGSGHMTTHWLGDNQSLWSHLKQSIIGMIEFNMFAFPMVGADICGFIGSPSEELCIRWMQVGAFYPFSRNHNDIASEDQDPARPGWDICPVVSREVILLKYKYLPYLYSLFHTAHMSGNSVIRPMFNLDPTDLAARDISDQFTWGDGIMIAPVTDDAARSRSVYFTAGNWYDLETGVPIEASASALQVDVPLESIPLYARGGTIIPWQVPGNTTMESRLNAFGLTVAIDAEGTASGEIYYDDGIITHVMSEAFINTLEFSEGTLSGMSMFDNSAADGLVLETVNFFGVTTEPSGVSVDGEPTNTYTYDATTQVLVLDLAVELGDQFVIDLVS